MKTQEIGLPLPEVLYYQLSGCGTDNFQRSCFKLSLVTITGFTMHVFLPQCIRTSRQHCLNGRLKGIIIKGGREQKLKLIAHGSPQQQLCTKSRFIIKIRAKNIVNASFIYSFHFLFPGITISCWYSHWYLLTLY